MEGPSSEGFGFAFNNRDFSDRVLHIEIIPDQVPPKNDSDCSLSYKLNQTLISDDCSDGVKVITLHCSSLVLAAKSPFFYKLFKIGMIDSQEKDVSLRINSSEEAALMDLLKFMYTNTLSSTTLSHLVDVLMAANEFEVTSCVKHCMKLLEETPMSLESALLYLKLPSTALAVEPLIDASKKYLAVHFRDFQNSKEEAMVLPLAAVETVLGIEGLQVDSEDVVYEFILDWGYKHYPNLEERREMLTNHLVRFICFPYMSCSKFREVLACADFHYEKVSKLINEALFIKDQVPYGQHLRATTTTTTTSGTRRLYNRRIVKVVLLDFPSPRAVIYFNLKREECTAMNVSNAIESESFLVGGRWFSIVAEKSQSLHFGLRLHMHTTKAKQTCTLDFDFAVMKKKPSNKFEIQQQKKSCEFTAFEKRGWYDLFGVSWAEFLSDESEYFIDGILHLRADVTLVKS